MSQLAVPWPKHGLFFTLVVGECNELPPTRTRVTNPQREELHMNVVVGIFDDERYMDNAIRQLAEHGS